MLAHYCSLKFVKSEAAEQWTLIFSLPFVVLSSCNQEKITETLPLLLQVKFLFLMMVGKLILTLGITSVFWTSLCIGTTISQLEKFTRMLLTGKGVVTTLVKLYKVWKSDDNG